MNDNLDKSLLELIQEAALLPLLAPEGLEGFVEVAGHVNWLHIRIRTTGEKPVYLYDVFTNYTGDIAPQQIRTMISDVRALFAQHNKEAA